MGTLASVVSEEKDERGVPRMGESEGRHRQIHGTADAVATGG